MTATITITEAILNEYRIASYRLPELEKAIAKLNKRAAKLDIAPVSMNLVRCENEIVTVGRNVMGEKIEQDREWAIVTVEGEPVVLNGWSFVATIEHTEAGNIVRRLPGDERNFDLLPYRTTGRVCDHCKMDRRRNDTYIVAHEDGTLAQVGSNCLIDFIGVNGRNPENIAKWLEGFYSLSTELDEGGEYSDFSGSGRGEYRINIEGFMATVAACVQDCGWLSKGKAWQQDRTELATANLVMEFLTARKRDHLIWKPELDQAEYDALRNDMKLAVEWARSLPEDIENEYLYNLRTSCMNDDVNYRRAGIVASLYIAYMNHMERQAKIAAEKAGKPQPSADTPVVEGRQVIEGEILSTKYYDSDFGSVLKMRVLADNGNTYFGTVPGDLVREIGKENLNGSRIRFTGTVKVKEQNFGYFSRPAKGEAL